jgi:hypothetical protein
MAFKVDVHRLGERHGTTGIYIRATAPDGGFGTYDIAELDRASLRDWLRSRGGDNLWAENTVFILLGHEPWAPNEGQYVPEVVVVKKD